MRAHVSDGSSISARVPGGAPVRAGSGGSIVNPDSDFAFQKSLATVEYNPSNHSYSVGDRLVYNGELCDVTATISVGDHLEEGTNISVTTVDDELSGLSGDIGDLSTNKADKTYVDDELAGKADSPSLLLNDTLSATGSYTLAQLPTLFNMFIVRMEGNWANYRTYVVSPGVSTTCNIDASASLYVHATYKINMTTNKFDVESFTASGGWTGAKFQVWGIALPLV